MTTDTDDAVARVERGALVLGDQLGKGGQGTVWPCPGRKINNVWPVAFKEYSAASLSKLDVPALEAMVAFVPSLDPRDGRWLCEQTSWPAAVVTYSGRAVGFLMRTVPDEFFVTLRGGTGKSRIAGFQYLLNGDAYLTRVGIPLTDVERFALLRDLAGTMARLHTLEVVIGDLSPHNVLFALKPEPRCFLIDCDAMRLRGRDVLAQAETVEWKVPTGEALATKESDAYKFALLAIRLFLGEQSGQDATRLTLGAPEVGMLAARSLADDPAKRPALREWLEPLERAVVTARTRPQPKPAPEPGAAKPGAAKPAVKPPAKTAPKPDDARKGAVVVLLLGLIIGAIMIASHSGSNSSNSSTGTESAQATSLEQLVSGATATRQQVNDAVAAIQACGQDGTTLYDAQTTLNNAAQSHRDLITQLNELTLDQLPGSMASELTQAWQSSADADSAYAQWASDLESDGCDPSTATNDPSYTTASDDDTSATSEKNSFLTDWNPIAEQYGLSTFSEEDL